jgi:hypothetical protein
MKTKTISGCSAACGYVLGEGGVTATLEGTLVDRMLSTFHPKEHNIVTSEVRKPRLKTWMVALSLIVMGSY